jgi:hypothetical protein
MNETNEIFCLLNIDCGHLFHLGQSDKEEKNQNGGVPLLSCQPQLYNTNFPYN